MKLSGLTTEELAAVVCDALERRGLTAVLTGGACVTIYAEGKYVSKDLDFIIAPQDRLAEVEAALAELGSLLKAGSTCIKTSTWRWTSVVAGRLPWATKY